MLGIARKLRPFINHARAISATADWYVLPPSPIDRTCTSKRVESDHLGSMDVPSSALYGVATARAIKNYDISKVKIKDFPEFIFALAHIKRAAAIANGRIGLLPKDVEDAITIACDELIFSNKYHSHFAVDMIQGGAGTSTNMCVNEIIANLAAIHLGEPMGDYSRVHPNDHVNMSQSTNCAYPSAAKLAVVFKHVSVITALEDLIMSLRNKADEFEDVIKMGRTQLQDAVPMTLGQEFRSFASSLEADLLFMKRNINQLHELNLGGTAIGTKICANPQFSEFAISALCDQTSLTLRSPRDFIEASSSTSSFLLFSNILRRIAVKVSKICNDLRLLSSGPRCGFNEINLPAVAPGSSIMPGKVNPVVPEVMNQICFQVIGTDQTIAAASEAGQLQLNAFEPIIIYNLLNNMNMMERGLITLRMKCIDGITANPARCEEFVNNSIGIVTALLPLLGYKTATVIAREALETGTSVMEIAKKYVSPTTLKDLLNPKEMTNPTSNLREN